MHILYIYIFGFASKQKNNNKMFQTVASLLNWET